MPADATAPDASVPGIAGSATADAVTPAPVMTRRELRERERALQLAAGEPLEPATAVLPIVAEVPTRTAIIPAVPQPELRTAESYAELLNSLVLPAPEPAPLATVEDFMHPAAPAARVAPVDAAPLRRARRAADVEFDAILPVAAPAMPGSRRSINPRGSVEPFGANALSSLSLGEDAVLADQPLVDAQQTTELLADALNADALNVDALLANTPPVNAPHANALHMDALFSGALSAGTAQPNPPRADDLFADLLQADAVRAGSVPAGSAQAHSVRDEQSSGPRRRTAALGGRSEPRTAPRAAATPGAVRTGPTLSITRRMATKTTAVLAMGFVALMAVATSVPAEALLTADDVKAAALFAKIPSSTEPGQSVIARGADSITVEADGYETATIAEAAAASGIRMEAAFVNNPAGSVQWPFAVGVHVGDRFGYRDCAGCSVNHGGQDFNPGNGAEIQSIADGVVTLAEDGEGSLGVHMMIEHQINGETVTSVYAHMQHGTMRYSTGDTVKVGDVIGNTGTTGMSTGPHLHFEIRLGGISGVKVDPLDWLYANTN